MKTARFSLTQSCYIQQASQSAPAYVGADPQHPVVVVLPADTKEHRHLTRLSDGAEPQPEPAPKPAHAGISSANSAQSAATFYGPAKPAPVAPALPVEGGKKGGPRAADKD